MPATTPPTFNASRADLEAARDRIAAEGRAKIDEYVNAKAAEAAAVARLHGGPGLMSARGL